MTMKKLIILCALSIVILAAPFTASAQTSITTTTTSAAITGLNTTQSFNITVGSATGMTVNGILYIDGSVYRILAIASTTITVINQYMPATHASGVTVYVVPTAAQVGIRAVGSCLRSTAGQYPAYSPYTLMFKLDTGDVGACRLDSGAVNKWVWTNPYSVGSPSNNPPQTR